MKGTSNSNNSNGIWVIGAGGHAKVVIETIRATGEMVAGALDSDPTKNGSKVLDVPVLAPFNSETIKQHNVHRAVIAIGNNETRKRLAEELLGTEWATIVHPFSYVSPSAKLGAGAVVFAGAVLQSNAVVGEHAILNTSCSVDHDSIIGAYSHVAPGARLAGGVRLGEAVLVGIGSSILPATKVGAYSTIAGGAMVVDDVPDRTLAIGVPAVSYSSTTKTT